MATQKVYAIFNGGVNYSPGTLEDVEECRSISDAKELLYGRYHGFDPRFPCVEPGATLDLYFADPRDGDLDLIPDRSYEIGPRGGIREAK